MEYFKDIPGYTGIYQISNLGRVYSIRRKKFMSCPYSSDGYRNVIFRVNKRQKSRTVHSLVLEAFQGPRPVGYVINHINFKRDDNRLTNLEYVSQKINVQHSRKAGRHDKRSQYKDDKFSPAEILEIRDSGLSDKDLSILFGCAKSFINKIKRRAAYAWV